MIFSGEQLTVIFSSHYFGEIESVINNQFSESIYCHQPLPIAQTERQVRALITPSRETQTQYRKKLYIVTGKVQYYKQSQLIIYFYLLQICVVNY